MRFETGQHLQMGQQMRLAPRMIQAMEILQLSAQELEERIEQAIEENIALEIDEPDADETEIEAARREQQREDSEGERELYTDSEHDSEVDFERLDTMASAFAEAFDPDERTAYRESHRVNSDGADAKMEAMANTAARGESLTDQLIKQWALADVDDAIRRAGEHLINFIEEDGYIRTDLESIEDQAPGDVDRELTEEALETLQHWLEPAGLAARDISECLRLQIEALEAENPEHDYTTELLLVTDYLEDIKQNRLPAIVQKSGLPLEEIQEAKEMLRVLNPSPGRQLVSAAPEVVIPDALVEYDDSLDDYVVSLFDGRLPSLRLSDRYSTMAKDSKVDPKTRAFISTNVRDARWLMEAIEQRNNTLLRVVRAVVSHQRDFFDQGPEALKPLPMTQVADQLGVHVATVSRAVNGKYIQTPRGVIPLRKMFSSGMETSSGEDVTGDAVRAALRELIETEDKTKPYGDDQLTKQLNEKGIKIARRTVAKYRSQLGFPSAKLRKEFT